MELLWDGIKFGLALSILVGPLLFALIQTSIEEGFRAGWMLGLGIWVSDLLFVAVTYFAISLVAAITKWDGLEMTLGIVGGIILILFGTGSLLSRPPAIKNMKNKAIRHHSYLSLWLKGFLLNTLNPFTFFFWIGVSGLVFTNQEPTDADALYFYGGLIGTLVVTDSTKAALAKAIRRWLKPHYILWLRRIVGAVFIVFGIVLLVRVSIFHHLT
ncbi:MAG TPA: LysE family translocator [Bacteroidetes bacterium]|nr:LysE family translocator [Bacteroidota bacterium]